MKLDVALTSTVKRQISNSPKTTMQRVLVALMLGAAAAFQRTPVVRSRVLAVFIQLHSPGRSSSRRRGAAPQRSLRELK